MPTLPRTTMLIACSAAVNPLDVLPARSPLVTRTRRLFRIPWPDRHRIAVSEPHVDISHTLRLRKMLCDSAERPNPAPTAVTLVEPVDAAFHRCTALTLPIETDMPTDTLPPRSPTVNDIRQLPAQPRPTLQRNDVSEPHEVPSHADLPDLPCNDRVASPIPSPTIVILIDPVAPTFLLRPAILIDTGSDDTPLLSVPSSPPQVNTACRVPTAPRPPWQRIDVSESQLLRSHPLRPDRKDALYASNPSPEPSMLRLMDPVAALLLLSSTLPQPRSVENPLVLLPLCPPPAVIETRVLRHRACPV